MKMFDIWSEGFWANGDGKQPAHFHASRPGATLQEACDTLAAEDAEFSVYYNRDSMTFWGCRLFDNHSDAARSFG